MFAMRSTVHTTTQHTPSQLVFGRDVILNINQEANWQLIKQRKQALINKGNQKENRRRQSHVYHTGDKVLLKNVWKTKNSSQKKRISATNCVQQVSYDGTLPSLP